MVCLSETLARKERNGLGSHDLHTTTLLSYSTMNARLTSGPSRSEIGTRSSTGADGSTLVGKWLA